MARRRSAKTADTPQSLAVFIRDKCDEQHRNVQARHATWYNDIAFYLGYQFYSWTGDILSYFSPPHQDANGLFMVVGNQIRPLAQKRIAKYVGNKPQVIVTAQNEDPVAIEQADRETCILNALWKSLNIRTFLVDIAHWMVITNQSFARVRWDNNYGEGILNPAYVDDIVTPELSPTMHRGQMTIDRFTGYQVIMDDTKKTFKDVREQGWMIITSVVTKEMLIRDFPEKKDKIIALQSNHPGSISQIEERVVHLQDYGTERSRQDERDRYGLYQTHIIRELYHAPTSDEPDGVYAVVVDDEENCLYEGKLPHKLKKIPIIMFQDQRGLDTLWGRSLVSQSRQLQKIYNLILSKIFSYSMLPPIYAFPRGCGIDLESLPDDAYIITEYDMEEGQPQIINPPNPPDIWMYLLNYVQGQLEHEWGTHEVSMRGTTPSNTRLSGRGIYLLQEGDVERHSPWYMTWEDSLEDLGELILEIGADKFDETRSMYYRGNDGYEYPIEFSKKDITGKGKVQVEVGSEFMRNKQAMQKFFTDIMAVMPNMPGLAKTLNDPVGIHNLLSMLDEGLANRLVYRNSDAQTAEYENQKLLKQQKIDAVEEWHVHVVHLRQHLRMMNTPQYRKLPKQLRDAWYKQHMVMGHGQYMEKAIKTMGQAQQGQMPGGGGGGGMFREAGEMPVEPTMTAIDAAVEDKVQPDPGQYGMEETP